MNPTIGLPENADREILSMRVLDAPRDRVWKVWTDPEILAQWWGPTGFTNTFHVFDLKPGGEWNFIMHGPDGTDYKNHSVFVEVAPQDRLVFDHTAPAFRATILFEDAGGNEGGKTKVTWSMLFDTAAGYDRVKGFAVEGNRQNLDKLEALLAKMA